MDETEETPRVRYLTSTHMGDCLVCPPLILSYDPIVVADRPVVVLELGAQNVRLCLRCLAALRAGCAL